METQSATAPRGLVQRERERLFLQPVDRVMFVYLLYIPVLVALFGRPLADFTHIFVGNALVGLFVWLLARYATPGRAKILDFVRAVYPAVLFGYFYNQTGSLMRLFHTEFFDSWFTNWEVQMYGFNASLWIEHNVLGADWAIWLTEPLSLAYFSYYLMFPVMLIALLAKKRNDLVGEYMTASAIVFFVSYNLFWFFPLEGPRWHFAELYQQSVDGPFFREMVNYVIANGAVRGGCMPSTHTGVALVTLMFLWRDYRTAFWISLPFGIGIALGAVYGRFHYPTDIVVGALIAAPLTVFTMRNYARWNARNT